MSLDALLQSNRLWRAGERKAQVPALSTGYQALDVLLPGGGWPDSGLVELLPARSGIGELRLLMPVLARLSRGSRWIAWIARRRTCRTPRRWRPRTSICPGF